MLTYFKILRGENEDAKRLLSYDIITSRLNIEKKDWKLIHSYVQSDCIVADYFTLFAFPYLPSFP